MAIILDTGVSLPDIPEGVLDVYPYAAIVSINDANYVLVASDTQAVGVLGTDIGASYDVVALLSGSAYQFTATASSTEWANGSAVAIEDAQLPVGVVEDTRYSLVWANCTIMRAKLDEDGNPVASDEVYYRYGYPSEIPAWVLNSYPYAIIIYINEPTGEAEALGDEYNSYQVIAASSEFLFNENKLKCLKSGYICGTAKNAASDWEFDIDSVEPASSEIGPVIIMPDLMALEGNIHLHWSNHNIMMAEVDENDNWIATENVYYSGSGATPSLEEYKIEHSEVVSIARGIRRLTRSHKGYSLESMINSLNTLQTLTNTGGKEWGVWKDFSDGSWPSLSDQIYFENGIWVAKGDDGAGIYYSEDLRTWTPSNITSSIDNLYGFMGGKWIAEDSSGWLTSEDGKVWNSIPTSFSGSTNKLAYGNGIWVLSNYKYLYYSEDFANWTNCLSEPRIEDIEYANGIWVAGAYNTQYSGIGLWYSEDGKTWTKATLDKTDIGCEVLLYANGLWIAGMTKSFWGGAYYSKDGKTWAAGSGLAGYPKQIVFGNGMYVALTDNSGSNYTNGGIYYSEDGIEWTLVNNIGGAAEVRYAHGIWLADGLTVLYCSTDGKTWKFSDLNYMETSTFGYDIIGNSNGMWFVISGTKCYYSPSIYNPE